ncbi:MAG: hypothetical protein AAF637_20380 [Pseudomonadota bacterium]
MPPDWSVVCRSGWRPSCSSPLFVVVFEWGDGGRRWLRLALAVIYGAAISAAVTLVFQELFLVRLP